MSAKVIDVGSGESQDWRPFRFPPLGNRHAIDQGADPVALQRAIADGFQEGNERGYREGLLQGQESGQREGFSSGREEGLREGREQGRSEGRRAFDLASQPLDSVSQQLRNYMAEFEFKRRQDLLALVKKVAQQVIRCELTLNPAQLLTLAEEALATMPEESRDVHILLHPEECERIKDLVPDRAAVWRLVADDSLAMGECRIVTAQAEVDIGCQQRLDVCVETLSGHLNLIED